MFFCKHKYGKVDDGFQYCEKCGKAESAPEKTCSHKWEEFTTLTVSNRFTHHTMEYIYVMKCSVCGEMKKISTDDL